MLSLHWHVHSSVSKTQHWLHRCQQGDGSLEAEDWDTGASVSIPLDPKQAPVKTAEALFTKARKQRRTVDHLGPLIQVSLIEWGLSGLQKAVSLCLLPGDGWS